MSLEQQIQSFRTITPSLLRVYGEICDATVPGDRWAPTWYALISLKGHLQSFPDFIQQSIWAAPTSDGKNYRLTVISTFRTLASLEVWLTEGWSCERLLIAMGTPGDAINSEVREQLS